MSKQQCLNEMVPMLAQHFFKYLEDHYMRIDKAYKWSMKEMEGLCLEHLPDGRKILREIHCEIKFNVTETYK